ncbi:Peptidylprolyl isomerase domain and WD repeat-containing protein 1, partial [Fragariocoptes setiger]
MQFLPSCDAYEKSYMHREIIQHVVVTKTDFVITASIDGAVKFWKKVRTGIEFVKHFRIHMGPIDDMNCNHNGWLLVTISSADKSIEVFDVVNFDMINMIQLKYSPSCFEWISCKNNAVDTIIVADENSSKMHVYGVKNPSDEPLRTLDKIHSAPIIKIRFNHRHNIIVSVDSEYIIEYWYNAENDYKFVEPGIVKFESKLDTDLYEFCRAKIALYDLTFSADGRYFATCSSDRCFRLFDFATGKILRIYDESLEKNEENHKQEPRISNLDFARRMTIEREIAKADQLKFQNVIFDQHVEHILYPSMLGVKVINLRSNEIRAFLGKAESLRPLKIALFQFTGSQGSYKTSLSLEQRASENTTLDLNSEDPALFCTAFKRNRFYCFSNRSPEESNPGSGFVDRDIFNEKPTREEILASVDVGATAKEKVLYENATIHTTKGDIHLELTPKRTPKTVENFCVHAKNGYYNGHIFHRIIKDFMIQTGDPTGTGIGGESIWGAEFEDELDPQLKFDRPFKLAMANAGPNTNGSQFFITVVPCSHLDQKHTIFGRVVGGMDIVQQISTVKTHRKTDKPYDDIKIVSISLLDGIK